MKMEDSLTDKVRSSCKAVAEKAIHVQINYDYIQPYASLLPANQAGFPELDANIHYVGYGKDTAAYFLILDTINFGSGYFPDLTKREGMSGYFTVASSLTDHFKRFGPLNAHQLLQITVSDCTKIFGQQPENQIIQELMQLFATALNHLGRCLIERFQGSFTELLRAADHSAEQLIKLLIEMPYFNDVEFYNNLRVHFYKRAQLTAADLSLAFKRESYGFFYDLDRLTLFADNLVPHVLRIDGILLYDDDLTGKIDSGQLIPSMSAEEIEIRACAVHAVELIKKELQKSGHDISALGLDYLLWNRGQQPYYKKVKPRHRTRTVFY